MISLKWCSDKMLENILYCINPDFKDSANQNPVCVSLTKNCLAVNNAECLVLISLLCFSFVYLTLRVFLWSNQDVYLARFQR